MKTKTDFVGARLPTTTVVAVDAVAARKGITRTDALNQLLIAGLSSQCEARPGPDATIDLSQIQVEAVFPPKLGLLLVEIAARLTLLGKSQNIDMAQADRVRAAYKKEFL